jgi:signal peptidase I
MAQKIVKPSPKRPKQNRPQASSGAGSGIDSKVGSQAAPHVGSERQHTLPTLGSIAMMWAKVLPGYFIFLMLFNGAVIASFNVPTSSMENTVMTGDFVWVNKFIFGPSTPQILPFVNKPLPFYKFPAVRQPQRGDVIVFIYPGDRDQSKPSDFLYYLKRCVATGGDVVEVRNKELFVNGQPQPLSSESKLRQPDGTLPLSADDQFQTFPVGAGFTRDNYGPLRVPRKGEMIALAPENIQQWDTFIRREGHEVGQLGSEILIDGKPATQYAVERDYCFGMGDNRDNSLDSRYWGFVPIESVVGTPMMVYWSWDTNLVAESSWETWKGKFQSLRRDRIGTVIH